MCTPGNKREKPGLASVRQAEVLNSPLTAAESILWLQLGLYFLRRSFQRPNANNVAKQPIAIYPTTCISISFLYNMKHIARIQPDRAKCSGYCLLSIARKPNRNLDIAPKSTYQSKNQNGYCSKNHLKITHNGLKIAYILLKIDYIGLKIDALRILYIETRSGLKPE